MKGFEKMINSQECIDIDECGDESPHSCHHYATCENTYGSFKCSCLDGFTGNGFTHCDDIDECQLAKKLNNSLCTYNGICHNTIGFYMCECVKGFELKNNSVNECIGWYYYYETILKRRKDYPQIEYRQLIAKTAPKKLNGHPQIEHPN